MLSNVLVFVTGIIYLLRLAATGLIWEFVSFPTQHRGRTVATKNRETASTLYSIHGIRKKTRRGEKKFRFLKDCSTVIISRI